LGSTFIAPDETVGNGGFMSVKSLIVLVSLATITILAFQNCSDVSFSSKSNVDPSANEPNNTNEAGGSDKGVLGGHFDLDTSTQVYNDGQGTTTHHEHEYDDKHDTNVADFFALRDNGFDEIQSTANANEEFYIIVANADLSPKVDLSINGVATPVVNFQNNLNRTKFSISGVPGTTQLSALKAIVHTDAILNSGLVPTQTSCVRRNDFSADGRYRNGALVIQAIRASRIADISPTTRTALNNDALLWEATIFWHDSTASCL
jgi:hypothetical protein